MISALKKKVKEKHIKEIKHSGQVGCCGSQGVKESPSESRAEETEGVTPHHSRQKAQCVQSLEGGAGLVWAKNFKEIYAATQNEQGELGRNWEEQTGDRLHRTL